jgi:hypothetical protein
MIFSHKNIIMKYHLGQTLLLCCIIIILHSCKKKSDDTGGGGSGNGGGNGGGGNTSFSISGSSPDYLYWGDELTINGSGFSTNKNEYQIRYISYNNPGCSLGNFEVVSATPTQLKVKMAYGSLANSKKCGPTNDRVMVTLNGKNDTTNAIYFVGWPRIQGVCTHFGGWAGDYVIPGDSVMLNLAGATGIYASVNNNNKNAELTVDGTPVPIIWRNYSGCTNGLGAVLKLDKENYGKLKCPGDPDWGGGGRKMLFKVSNPGTNRSDTMSLFVEWSPTWNFGQYTGPSSVSMSAGGFPAWTIKGNNMSYQKARFTATNCTLTTQEVSISHNGTFYDEGTIPIPLSVLTVGCNYQVSIITHCGVVRVLGGLQVKP